MNVNYSFGLGLNSIFVPSTTFNYRGFRGISGEMYHYKMEEHIVNRVYVSTSLLSVTTNSIFELEIGVSINGNERTLIEYPEYSWDRSDYVYGKGYGNEIVKIKQRHSWFFENTGYAKKWNVNNSKLDLFLGGGVKVWELFSTWFPMESNGTFIESNVRIGQFWAGGDSHTTVTNEHDEHKISDSSLSYYYLWAGILYNNYLLSLKINNQVLLSVSFYI